MGTDFRKKKFEDSPKDETDPVVLMRKIQKQLVYLEKKIDTLIDQSGRGSSGRGNFTRPRRTFGQSGRPSFGDRDRDRDRPRRDGGNSERRFDQPRANGDRKVFRKKKRFDGPKSR